MDRCDQAQADAAREILEEANDKMILDAICSILYRKPHGEVLALKERFCANRDTDDRYLADQILNWTRKYC
ncbi:MAG: hypothetical protein ACYS1A_18495 [Planctomycetota bacterium]|jgi:hypothetical protein